MYIPIVKPAIIPRFASENCPDHWQNIIIYGKCWLHSEEFKEKTKQEQLARQKRNDALWKKV